MLIQVVDDRMAETPSLQERPPFFLIMLLSLLMHVLFLGILFIASEYPFLHKTDTHQLSIIHINLSPPVLYKMCQKNTARRTSAETKAIASHDTPGKKQNGTIHAQESQRQAPAFPETTLRERPPLATREQLPSSSAAQVESIALTPGISPEASGSTLNDSTTKMDFPVEMPRYIRTPTPIYPRTARSRGQQGVVLLSVEVLANGRTGQILVKKSSGYNLLDRAALDTVRTWQFEPARKKQTPTIMTVDIPIRFSLKEYK